MNLRIRLEDMNACSEARDWAGGKDLATAWATCERADWMLWYACRVGVSRLFLSMAAHDCIDAAPRADNVFARAGVTYARQLATAALVVGMQAERAVYAALRSCWKGAEYPTEGYWPSDDNGTYSSDRAALDKRFCDIIRERIPLSYLL